MFNGHSTADSFVTTNDLLRDLLRDQQHPCPMGLKDERLWPSRCAARWWQIQVCL